MAVPVDYQQYWTQGNKGFADAMPHINKVIQDGKPGSPTLQRYIDEFEMRVGKGENPKSVSDELASMFENDIRNGVQHADVNVPNVGFNQGAPAVGNAPTAEPVAQAPNSFQSGAGYGSMTNTTPPAPVMGGGVTANAAPTGADVSGGLPPIDKTISNPAGTVNGSETVVSRPSAQDAIDEFLPKQSVNFSEKGSLPAGYNDKIDLTKGRAQPMDIATTPAPPRKMMNRGEQEQAMDDIERVKKLEGIDGGLDFKRDKLEMESKIKILKAMSSRLSDQEKRDLMRVMGEKGMTLKAQIAVMDATIRAKNAEDMNKTREETNRIRARKGSNDMPKELKDAKENFHKAAGRATAYLSKDKVEINGAEAHRVNAEREQTRKLYNKMVKEYNAANGTNIATIDIDGRNVDPPTPTTGIDYTEE